jgi:hypothetical protein
MKQDQMIALGLAAVAVYFITSKNKANAGSTAKTGIAAIAAKVSEIFDASGQAYGNGWRYFSDGTSIDPSGNYYQGGGMIWANPSTYI